MSSHLLYSQKSRLWLWELGFFISGRQLLFKSSIYAFKETVWHFGNLFSLPPRGRLEDRYHFHVCLLNMKHRILTGKGRKCAVCTNVTKICIFQNSLDNSLTHYCSTPWGMTFCGLKGPKWFLPRWVPVVLWHCSDNKTCFYTRVFVQIKPPRCQVSITELVLEGGFCPLWTEPSWLSVCLCVHQSSCNSAHCLRAMNGLAWLAYRLHCKTFNSVFIYIFHCRNLISFVAVNFAAVWIPEFPHFRINTPLLLRLHYDMTYVEISGVSVCESYNNLSPAVKI